ncbi:MAG: hypothetical protein WBP81_13360 [Solirubrobacteraceae bacterium]
MADLNQLAARLVKPATEDADARPERSEGSRWARGWAPEAGRARAERMTPEQRSEAARKADEARWRHG